MPMRSASREEATGPAPSLAYGLTAGALAAALLVAASCFAAPQSGGVVAAERPDRQAERRARVAYYQGGDYSEYHDLLVALAGSLAQMGVIDGAGLPAGTGDEARPIWEWLAAPGRAAHGVEFLADGFYSADWDDDRRTRVRGALLERIRERADVDVVLAFGTWAGKDLAIDEHDTSVLVVSASDAVASGIVASIEDSGRDHVHAHLDPARVERQVRLFHEAVGFRSLGLAFEDSQAGRSYAGLAEIEALGAELGFDVIECHTLSDIPDRARAGESVVQCVELLVERADALYLTEQGGVNEATLPVIARTASAHRLPTFSQRGTSDVRFGVLMSMARGASVRATGAFHAGTLVQVIDGSRPRDLPQVFTAPTELAINLDTARAIGYLPTSDILFAADEVYGGEHVGR